MGRGVGGGKGMLGWKGGSGWEGGSGVVGDGKADRGWIGVRRVGNGGRGWLEVAREVRKRFSLFLSYSFWAVALLGDNDHRGQNFYVCPFIHQSHPGL